MIKWLHQRDFRFGKRKNKQTQRKHTSNKQIISVKKRNPEEIQCGDAYNLLTHLGSAAGSQQGGINLTNLMSECTHTHTRTDIFPFSFHACLTRGDTCALTSNQDKQIIINWFHASTWWHLRGKRAKGMNESRFVSGPTLKKSRDDEFPFRWYSNHAGQFDRQVRLAAGQIDAYKTPAPKLGESFVFICKSSLMKSK